MRKRTGKSLELYRREQEYLLGGSEFEAMPLEACMLPILMPCSRMIDGIVRRGQS